MIDLLNRERLIKAFLKWCNENNIKPTEYNFIGFLDANGFLIDRKIIMFLKGNKNE